MEDREKRGKGVGRELERERGKQRQKEKERKGKRGGKRGRDRTCVSMQAIRPWDQTAWPTSRGLPPLLIRKRYQHLSVTGPRRTRSPPR